MYDNINYLGRFMAINLKAHLDKQVFCTIKNVRMLSSSIHNAIIWYSYIPFGDNIKEYMKGMQMPF